MGLLEQKLIPKTQKYRFYSKDGIELKKKKAIPKRKKKTPEKKLKEKLWGLCKQITRAQYGNSCYTCGKGGLVGSSWQTGHFIPSSVCGAFLRYDLRNLRPQCYRCNIDLSGNGALFYRRLVSEHGQEYVDQLFRDKEKIQKADAVFLERKIAEYTELLSTPFS